MYLKRAIYSMKRGIGKNLILVILFSVIFAVTLSLLLVFLSANKKVDYMQKALGSAVTIRVPLHYAVDGEINDAYVYKEDAEKFINSKYVESYNYIRTYGYIDFVDLETVTDEENIGLYEYMQENSPSGILSDALMIAVSNPEYFDAFTVYGFKLVEGEYFTNEDKNSVLISENLAKKNGLKIGDEIELRSIGLGSPFTNFTEDDVKYATMTVSGLFSSPNLHEAGYANVNAWEHPDNMVFGSFEIASYLMDVKSRYDTPQIEKLTVYLKSPNDVGAFIEETKVKMNIEEVTNVISGYGGKISELERDDFFAAFDINRNYTIQVDQEWYNIVAKPMETIQNIIGMFILGTLLGSVIVMVLIISISLKGRKREFGVLLSMGETKGKIMGQIFVEILLPLALAACIGIALSAVVQPIIENFSTRTLATEARETQEENRATIKDKKFELPEWTNDVNHNMWERNSKGIVIDSELEYQAEPSVYFLYFGTVFALIFVALAIQIFAVLRVNPARMLTKKE